MQKFVDACEAGPDEPKAPPSSTVKGSIPSNHKIQVDGECIMQNKQLQSDWQQESASENLVGFVKYWPLSCQTGKWEIEKKQQKWYNQMIEPEIIKEGVNYCERKSIWN